MSYVVLARKWRPMTFDDLVGQAHVSRTLGNAITSGRVAHAFLFTGVRGVGKTTSARILAKALNCMGTAEAPRTGPTTTPCLVCAACKEITAGTDVDVREIDGASYNGVDEVRKLQDSLPYRPARDRYKIFIVDEVHMLSTSAWNAFLKTLEEPPPHVKFIFATTEVHKVPITILSRVQRFDFKMIPTQLIAERLRHVLATEKIAADEQALSIIAREAAGSMRDAMSLLDQVIAWNAERLDGDSVARVLGVASHKVLYDVARSLLEGSASGCLETIAALSNQGYDMGIVARDLLSLLRDLVVAKVCKEPEALIDLADDERRDIVTLSSSADADDLLRLHQGFSAAYDDVVRSGQARAALEMLLVRLSRRPPLIPVDDIVLRLISLEKRLGAPAGPAGSGTTGSGPAAGGGARIGPGPAGSGRSESPRRSPVGADATPAEPVRAAATSPAPSPPTPASAVPKTPPAREPTKAPASTPGPEPVPAETSALLSVWRRVIDRVREERGDLAACLQQGVVLDASPERLAVAFEAGSVFERAAKAPDAMALLVSAARAELGGEPAVVIEGQSKSLSGPTVAALDIQEREERKREAVARAKEHPRIAEAAQILGARLKEIRVPEE